jgi:hypothetical protein
MWWAMNKSAQQNLLNWHEWIQKKQKQNLTKTKETPNCLKYRQSTIFKDYIRPE